MDDVQLREELSRELAETSPPLGTVVADALRAGTRARRRRRFALAGSGAAVVLLAAGVFLAGNLGRAPVIPQQPGAVASPVQKPTTGAAVIALLTDLMPSGGTTTEVEGSTEDGWSSGTFLYDDGHGAATVFASVADKAIDYGAGSTSFGCPADEAGFSCVKSVTPDGFDVRTATMGPYTTACTEPKCGLKDVRVEVKRPDGVYIVIESYSGPFGQGRAPTRADTLLTVNQMIAMARDPRWGLTMDASFVDNAQATVRWATVTDGRGAKPATSK